jgi:hypothetical protein
MIALALLALRLSAPAAAAADFERGVDARRFLRGNLHAHTRESDGDSTPERVTSWYADHGYAFLSITDHDKLVMPAAPAGLALIPGVELTSRAGRRGARIPVHVNAVCAASGAAGVTLDATPGVVLRATLAAGRATAGLLIVNHPNFGEALDAADLLAAPSFEMLEIASGHPGVHDDDAPGRASAEELWDVLLSTGRRVLAVAVDDSHDFADHGEARRPGRAWIEVWGAEPTAEGLCAALARGDFYASKGARLESLEVSGGTMTVTVADWTRRSDRVEFIGAGGKVLAVKRENPARFELPAGEPYVRVRVTQRRGRRAWSQAYFAR